MREVPLSLPVWLESLKESFQSEEIGRGGKNNIKMDLFALE